MDWKFTAVMVALAVLIFLAWRIFEEVDNVKRLVFLLIKDGRRS
jgi:hypothetical protein